MLKKWMPIEGNPALPLPQPLDQMIAQPQSIGHHRQCRIDRGAGWEETGVGNVEVIHFMRPAIPVERGSLRIVAESDRTVLMRHAGERNALAHKKISREQALMAFMAVDAA